MSDVLWYYSGLEQIDSALRSGFLSPLQSSAPVGSPPVLFLYPEPLDAVERLLTSNGVVPARVGVDPLAAPFDWKGFVRASGATPRAIDQFQSALRSRLGLNPLHLRATFVPVPVAQWRVVEVFTDAGWAPHPEFSIEPPDGSSAGRRVAEPGEYAEQDE
jgi:hypothetical protein